MITVSELLADHIEKTGKSLLESVREVQSMLQPKTRLEFWDMIKEGYCTACGQPENWAGGERCHCQNDE